MDRWMDGIVLQYTCLGESRNGVDEPPLDQIMQHEGDAYVSRGRDGGVLG